MCAAFPNRLATCLWSFCFTTLSLANAQTSLIINLGTVRQLKPIDGSQWCPEARTKCCKIRVKLACLCLLYRLRPLAKPRPCLPMPTVQSRCMHIRERDGQTAVKWQFGTGNALATVPNKMTNNLPLIDDKCPKRLSPYCVESLVNEW